MFAHFMMGGLRDTCPHHAECSAVFDQKRHDLHASPPYLPNLAPSNFFCCFPGWKTSSKGNILPVWTRWSKKWQKYQKASKSTSSKTVLSSGKNVSVDILHQRERTFKVTEDDGERINTQFFINKFWGFWIPPNIRRGTLHVCWHTNFIFFTELELYFLFRHQLHIITYLC